MCKTLKDFGNIMSCTMQFIARTMMTVLLMCENMMRLTMSGLYNILSFLIQCLSLLPICLVFMITSKLKCTVCGGGGMCGASRGGACDCIMSAVAFIILFMLFKSSGVVDKIFYGLGYERSANSKTSGESLRSMDNVDVVPLSALPYVVPETSIATLDDAEYYRRTTEEEEDYYETNTEDQTEMAVIVTVIMEKKRMKRLDNSSEGILTTDVATDYIQIKKIFQNRDFTTVAYYFA